MMATEEAKKLLMIGKAMGISTNDLEDVSKLEIKTAEEKRVFDRISEAFTRIDRRAPEKEVYERSIKAGLEDLVLIAKNRREEEETVRWLERLESGEMKEVERQLRVRKPQK